MILTEFTYSLSLLMIALLNFLTLSITYFKIFGWIAAISLLISLISEIVAMVIIRNSKKNKIKPLKKETQKVDIVKN